MKKKLLYESPDVEVIELRLAQGVIMASGDGYNENSHTEYLGQEEDGGDLS